LPVVFGHVERINLTCPAILSTLIGLFMLPFNNLNVDFANHVQISFKVLKSVNITGLTFAKNYWVECQFGLAFDG
jgi:hypothetical protein